MPWFCNRQRIHARLDYKTITTCSGVNLVFKDQDDRLKIHFVDVRGRFRRPSSWWRRLFRG